MTLATRSARFLLILSVHSNLLRAALVTREIRVAASAQQSFQITENEFDPLEVWYKAKKVIAACLDIGRTQTREIAALVIFSTDAESIRWAMQENETVARGKILEASDSAPISATLRAWLLWNLTGVVLNEGTNDFGKTRARAPFDAEIPVAAVLSQMDALAYAPNFEASETERALFGAACWGWSCVKQ